MPCAVRSFDQLERTSTKDFDSPPEERVTGTAFFLQYRRNMRNRLDLPTPPTPCTMSIRLGNTGASTSVSNSLRSSSTSVKYFSKLSVVSSSCLGLIQLCLQRGHI